MRRYSPNFSCVTFFYHEPLVLVQSFRRERMLLVLRTRIGCPVSRSIYQARQFTKELPWSSSWSIEVADRTCGHPENKVSWSRPSVSTNLWQVIKKSSISLRHILLTKNQAQVRWFYQVSININECIYNSNENFLKEALMRHTQEVYFWIYDCSTTTLFHNLLWISEYSIYILCNKFNLI